MQQNRFRFGNNGDVEDLRFSGGRIPPQDAEIEKAVLCCIFLEGDIHYIMSEVSEDEFYYESHQKIFSCAKKMYTNQMPIDLLTITVELRKEGVLEIVGGAQYVTEVSGYILQTINLPSYVAQMKSMANKRSMIAVSYKAYRDCFDDTVSFSGIHQDISSALIKIEQGGMSKKRTVSSLSREVIEEMKDPNANNGVLVPLPDVRRYIYRYAKGDLGCIAARPSVGKTAYAVTLMLSIAKMGIPVGILSIEMTAKQLIIRILSALSEVPLEKIIQKTYTDDELERVEAADIELSSLPIFIEDADVSILTKAISKINYLVRKGVKIVFIDYLQLMTSDSQSANRNNELDEVGRVLKSTAKSLDIPIVALSQLSREGDGEPQLKHLRDSGAIEQHIDTCEMLYRPEMAGIKFDSQGFSTKGVMMNFIRKNRQGAIGDAELFFKGETVQVLDRQPRSAPLGTRIHKNLPKTPF